MIELINMCCNVAILIIGYWVAPQIKSLPCGWRVGSAALSTARSCCVVVVG